MKIKGMKNLKLVTPEEHRTMNRESISIKCEVDNTEIKETIKLIRLLKYEVIELKKQGIGSRVINKILLKSTLKNAKTILDSKNDLKS